VFVWAFISCSEIDKTSHPVAKVGDKILYRSEIDNLVPKNLSTADSTLMVEDYIKKWIQKELLIKKAEENLTPQQKDVTKELEEYRNSLIIYKYKKEILSQKLDTIVTASDINDYYFQHAESFILNKNIVQAVYMKLLVRFANPVRIKLLCGDESDKDFSDLKEYSKQYLKSFETFNNAWVEFDVVLNNMPTRPEDEERFLTRSNFLESKDAEYYYLLYIRNYGLIGKPAPVDYVSEQIKGLILNKRKLDFMKKIEVDIYNEGLRNNKFDIYNVKD